MTRQIDPPFGSYALPPKREACRQKADGCSYSRFGRAMISYYRKKALAKEQGPFDVQIINDLKLRLYPVGNSCEKRVFAGARHWNAQELAHLKRSVFESTNAEYVFLDVGANVGLYSLYAYAYTRERGKQAKILSVEPSIETRRRFEDNIAANGANQTITIITSAISDTVGEGFLGGADINRGEAHLLNNADSLPDKQPVKIDTLANIVAAHKLSHIDAMKVDIEGHDLTALRGFFAQSDPALFPSLLIFESHDHEDCPLMALCFEQGYQLTERLKLNVIMQRGQNV